MRDLPKEEDAEKDPAERGNGAVARGPADERGKRAGDGADLRAPRGPALRGRVPAEVGDDRREREENGTRSGGA